MKKTFRQYLTESTRLPHWPTTKEDLINAYMKVCVDADTGEVYMPYMDKTDSNWNVKFNDDLTVTIVHDENIPFYIHPHMLVDSTLPFPLKEVNANIEVAKGCKIKSFAGFPRKAKSIHFLQDSLDDSIHDFVGGPEEVETSFAVTLCDGITSLKGLPKIDEDGSLFFECSNISDFTGIPRRIKHLTIAHSQHFSQADFKFLPEESELLAFTYLPKLNSFHEIDKYVKKTNRIGFFVTKIFSCILGLAMIEGLSEVDDGFYTKDDESWPNDDATTIVNKFVGTKDIFEFQDALEEAGFMELAKL